MKTFEVMENVVIYQDLFSKEDLANILSVLKDSETDISNIKKPGIDSVYDDHGIQPEPRNDGSIIKKWAPWYTFGSRTIFDHTVKENDSDVYKKQKEIQDIIISAIKKVNDDYFPKFGASDWDFTSDFVFSELEALKHETKPTERFTIDFHTDTHEHTYSEPGWKHVLTYTFYPNDDYDGGEIQFLNEKDSKLITYKPKAGDISVFPSGKPYWHSAVSVKEGTKTFLRLFVLLHTDGTNDYKEFIDKYGKEKWEEHLQKTKVTKINVLIENDPGAQDILEGSRFPIYYINKDDSIYVDGRNL